MTAARAGCYARPMRPALVLFALAACAPAAPASTPGPSGNDGLSLDGVLALTDEPMLRDQVETLAADL